MLRQSSLTALLGFSICWGATPAMAQQSAGPEIFYEYARNKIGLLRYCRDQGLLGQVTADRAVKAIERGLESLTISEGLVKEQGDRAEKAGERGFWEANGQHDLAGVAALRRTTLIDLCQELGGQRTIYQAPAPTQIVQRVKAPNPVLNVDLPSPAVRPPDPPSARTKAAAPDPWVLPTCN